MDTRKIVVETKNSKQFEVILDFLKVDKTGKRWKPDEPCLRLTPNNYSHNDRRAYELGGSCENLCDEIISYKEFERRFLKKDEVDYTGKIFEALVDSPHFIMSMKRGDTIKCTKKDGDMGCWEAVREGDPYKYNISPGRTDIWKPVTESKTSKFEIFPGVCVGDIIVYIQDYSFPDGYKQGCISTVHPNSGPGQLIVYWNGKQVGSYWPTMDHHRKTTPEEIEAYKKGITNINDIKSQTTSIDEDTKITLLRYAITMYPIGTKFEQCAYINPGQCGAKYNGTVKIQPYWNWNGYEDVISARNGIIYSKTTGWATIISRPSENQAVGMHTETDVTFGSMSQPIGYAKDIEGVVVKDAYKVVHKGYGGVLKMQEPVIIPSKKHKRRLITV